MKIMTHIYDLNEGKEISPEDVTIFINHVKDGDVEGVNYFLQHGMDVNETDSKGNTALLWACKYKDKEMVELLLKQPHLIINLVNNSGTHPLIISLDENNSEEFILLLLSHPNIKVNYEDKDGLTVLMKLVLRQYSKAIGEVLKHSNLKINEKDKDGWTALMYACKIGNIDIVRNLLNYSSININEGNNSGYTALFRATEYNHLEVVKELLKHSDIDINKKDKDGWTALMLASFTGLDDIVNELVKYPKIDLDIQNEDKETALMCACFNGHIDIVKILLKQGARTDLKDRRKKTAYDIAKKPEIKQLVLIYSRDNDEDEI